jgi:putative endonuclease
MRVKDEVGRFGEDVAVARLRSAGLVLLDRNWRCSDGELDIVARDGSVVAFIEVKTRSTSDFGDPSEAVTHRKAARIHRLAARWLAEHPETRTEEIRFDIVAVVRRGPGGMTVSHLRGAF